jgi:hypothetical protein
MRGSWTEEESWNRYVRISKGNRLTGKISINILVKGHVQIYNYIICT